MGLGYILLWFSMLSCLTLLYRSLRHRQDSQWGWAVLSALIIVTTAVVGFIDLNLAGWYATALWLPLIVIPSRLMAQMEAASVAQNYPAARRLAKIVRWFHPMDGMWSLPLMYEAAEALKKGDEITSQRIADRISKQASLPGRVVYFQLLSHQGEWKKLLAWFKEMGFPDRALSAPSLLPAYLRTLGENHEVDLLVKTFAQSSHRLQALGPFLRVQSLLMLWAFTGRTENVDSVIRGAMSHAPLDQQKFWMASAHMAAGRNDVAEPLFQSLLNSTDARMRSVAENRLKNPLPTADSRLGTSALQFLQEFHFEMLQERKIATPLQNVMKPYVSYGLIAANAIMFLAEVAMGGSENFDTLFQLGGLLPEAVLAGQWWRLVTANFLHFGPLHLGMNLFALNLVGPFVEARLGHSKFLVSYLLCGISSMVAVTELHRFGFLSEQFLVGASGCVTGLIGIAAATFLRHWYLTRTAMAWQRLSGIGFALLIQVAFDLSTRQVSFTAHMAGTLTGFVLGLLWKAEPE